MSDEREIMTWDLFGEASRDLAQMVADDGYEPDMVLAIARDLTARREAEEALHRARRELEMRPAERTAEPATDEQQGARRWRRQ